jgi:hypothetical protein
VRHRFCASPVVLLILVANAAASVVGGEASAPSLASFNALQKRLGSPGLRLLDVRPKADYLGWCDWGNAADTPVVEGAERDSADPGR